MSLMDDPQFFHEARINAERILSLEEKLRQLEVTQINHDGDQIEYTHVHHPSLITSGIAPNDIDFTGSNTHQDPTVHGNLVVKVDGDDTTPANITRAGGEHLIIEHPGFPGMIIRDTGNSSPNNENAFYFQDQDEYSSFYIEEVEGGIQFVYEPLGGSGNINIMAEKSGGKINFWTHGGVAAVVQVYVDDGEFTPNSNNDIDLGSDSKRFKDLHIHGSVYVGGVALKTETATDHGSILGLGDDDHSQYLLVDGSRAMSGDLDLGNNNMDQIGYLVFNNPFASKSTYIWDNDSDIDFNVPTGKRFLFTVNSVKQIRIQDGAILPWTDNDIDLGSSSYEFKNLYIDGTAYIDYFGHGFSVAGNISLGDDNYLNIGAGSDIQIWHDSAPVGTNYIDWANHSLILREASGGASTGLFIRLYNDFTIEDLGGAGECFFVNNSTPAVQIGNASNDYPLTVYGATTLYGNLTFAESMSTIACNNASLTAVGTININDNGDNEGFMGPSNAWGLHHPETGQGGYDAVEITIDDPFQIRMGASLIFELDTSGYITTYGGGSSFTDNQVLAWDSATSKFTVQTAPSGGDEWGDVVDAHIVPDTDSTRNLGSNSKYFNDAWIDNLYISDFIQVNNAVADGYRIGSDFLMTGRAQSTWLYIRNTADNAYKSIAAGVLHAADYLRSDEFRSISDGDHKIQMDPAADYIYIRPGDTSSDNYFKFHSASTTSAYPQLLPSSANEGYLGNATYYYNRTYKYYDYRKSESSFDEYDDLALIEAMDIKRDTKGEIIKDEFNNIKMDKRTYPDFVKRPRVREIFSEGRNPTVIGTEPIIDPETGEQDFFIEGGAMSSLLRGAVKQLYQKHKDLQETVLLLTDEINRLKAK